MSDPFNWAFIGAGTLAKSVAKEITDSGRGILPVPDAAASFAL